MIVLCFIWLQNLVCIWRTYSQDDPPPQQLQRNVINDSMKCWGKCHRFMVLHPYKGAVLNFSNKNVMHKISKPNLNPCNIKSVPSYPGVPTWLSQEGLGLSGGFTTHYYTSINSQQTTTLHCNTHFYDICLNFTAYYYTILF